jgi:hypothetical protein
MEDYYLISSSLHLCLAASIALRHPGHRSTAVIMTRNAANAARFADAARHSPDVFGAVAVLEAPPGIGRWASRRALYRQIEALVAHPASMRIFTGNDRRLEYQYAMHVATRAGARVEGIYMDDGAATYVGQKSMHGFTHRHLEPLVRKLVHGWWFKDAVTQGASAWTSAVYVAFPTLVHPLLRQKKVVGIDVSPLRDEGFLRLVAALTDDFDALRQTLEGMHVVVSLPKEIHYLDRPQVQERLWAQLTARFDPTHVAVKPHPRSVRMDVLAKHFPGARIVNTNVGWEFLLALLPQDCAVVGDVSSTMITTRWIRPDLPVVATRPPQGVPPVRQALYSAIGIPVVDVDELAAALRERLSTGA